MRTEREMMDLMLGTAERDDRIRAVLLNGSRACAMVKKDRFQDYDIIYFVRDFQFFIDTPSWIDVFGERIMLEMPMYKDFAPSAYGGVYNYQMLFADGNRIDLTFAAVEKADEVAGEDEPGVVLLDKDGLLSGKVFRGEEAYHVRPPGKKEFEDCCNSFWWVLQNVAKGVRRGELPYAMKMLDYARESLDRVVSWHIGMEHDFKVSSGKMGKYFEKYLDRETWLKYAFTFPRGDYEDIWRALFTACDLFRLLAVKIADRFTYVYPHADDRAMTAYLRHVKDMP